MRKILPYIFAIFYGLFGALFTVCFLEEASASFSPFYENEQPRFLTFCVLVGILALLAVGVILFLNVKFFPNAKNVKAVALAECLITVLTLFPFWIAWEKLFDWLQIAF